MKDRNRKTKLFVWISVIIALLVLPLVIHILFKIHPKYDVLSSEWTAGEILGYYGTILAAFATVVGVWLSIRYAQKNFRDDTVYRCLPFMVVESKAEVPTLYYIINGGNVTLNKSLSINEKLATERDGIRLTDDPNGIKRINTRTILTYLNIVNVGNGVATTFSVGVDKKGAIDKSFNYTLAQSLKVNDSFNTAIFCDNPDARNVGEYEICISYYDLIGNRYEQRLSYTISERFQSIEAELRLNGTQVKISTTETP